MRPNVLDMVFTFVNEGNTALPKPGTQYSRLGIPGDESPEGGEKNPRTLRSPDFMHSLSWNSQGRSLRRREPGNLDACPMRHKRCHIGEIFGQGRESACRRATGAGKTPRGFLRFGPVVTRPCIPDPGSVLDTCITPVSSPRSRDLRNELGES